jgi:hypothetical protein
MLQYTVQMSRARRTKCSSVFRSITVKIRGIAVMLHYSGKTSALEPMQQQPRCTLHQQRVDELSCSLNAHSRQLPGYQDACLITNGYHLPFRKLYTYIQTISNHFRHAPNMCGHADVLLRWFHGTSNPAWRSVFVCYQLPQKGQLCYSCGWYHVTIILAISSKQA